MKTQLHIAFNRHYRNQHGWYIGPISKGEWGKDTFCFFTPFFSIMMWTSPNYDNVFGGAK